MDHQKGVVFGRRGCVWSPEQRLLAARTPELRSGCHARRRHNVPHVKRVNPGEGLLAVGVESEGASLYVGIEEIESKGTNIDEEGGALHEEHPVAARVGEEDVIVRRGEKKRCAQ